MQCVEADLLDRSSLREAAEGADTVYNMASPMPGEDGDFERVNSELASNLVQIAHEAEIKTIVYLSTLDVFGSGTGTIDIDTPINPGNPYQASKVSAEKILLEHANACRQPRVVIIRAARAVGSRDWTLAVPLLRMISGHKVILPESTVMSFTHPKDIAQAMYRAAINQTFPAGVYMIKSFDVSLEGLAKALARAVKQPVVVARAGLLSRPDLPRYTAQQMAASLKLAPQSSWRLMEYSPQYDLMRTCEDIANWYKREPWVTGAT